MVRATLIRLRLTPSIWLTVASTMWKNSATTTMKMAGALPMPNTKIATGSQAIGDTDADRQHRGNQQSREHPRRRRQHGDHERHAGGWTGVEADADLPALRRIEELGLLGEVAEKDVRRRQQFRVRHPAQPEQFPDPGEQADRHQRPADARGGADDRLRQHQSAWRPRRIGAGHASYSVRWVSDVGHRSAHPDLYLRLA